MNDEITVEPKLRDAYQIVKLRIKVCPQFPIPTIRPLTHKLIFSMLIAENSNVLSPHQNGGVTMMQRITANPMILGGKPIIKGTRMSVEFILDLLASGVSEGEILEDYPHLTKNDIQACLRYAARSCKNEIYVALETVTA